MDNEIIWRIANLICQGVSLEDIRNTFIAERILLYPDMDVWEGEFYLSYRAAQVYLGDPIV
jgi:hypothetical protein